jgi:hypothetical protein
MNADPVEAFITRWQSAGGSERANYQLFITELCELLGLPKPEPAVAAATGNAYVFERRVNFRHGDGSSSNGYIDCYRRACFILEAKQTRMSESLGRVFDDALLRARGQAENYARALPADEGRPPFLVVVDVGNVIELYAEFSRSGATYVPFPTRARTASGWPTCATRPSAPGLPPSGSTRSASTRRATPPASRAKSPATSPRWPSCWKKPAMRQKPSPAFSPAACSACSPRMSA